MVRIIVRWMKITVTIYEDVHGPTGIRTLARPLTLQIELVPRRDLRALAREDVPMACLAAWHDRRPLSHEAKCWFPPHGQEEILWTHRPRNCGILEGPSRAHGQGTAASTHPAQRAQECSLHNRMGMLSRLF